jgi:phage FluMu protein Com
MATISVRCTSCNKVLKVGADKTGKKVRCPDCEKIFVIQPVAGQEDEKKPETAVVAAEAPKPAEEEEEGGSYGVIVDNAPKPDDLESKKKKKEEKKAPKLFRKVKAIPEAEKWEKVKLGMLFLFYGAVVWGFIHVLSGTYLVLGLVEDPEMAKLVGEELAFRRAPMPEKERFWDINTLNIYIGIVSGPGFLGYAKGVMVTCFVLYFCQVVLQCVGYGYYLNVPERMNMFGQAITMYVLSFLNLMPVIFLKILPIAGAYSYVMLPYVIPELPMIQYNIERCIPIQVLWGVTPFWEYLALIAINFLFYLEPIFGAYFVWCTGLVIKEDRVAQTAHGLIQLCFGIFFIQLAFHMFSICGTSPVLVIVVRCLYILWYCFTMLFIIRYAAMLMKCREILQKKIAPAHEAT